MRPITRPSTEARMRPARVVRYRESSKEIRWSAETFNIYETRDEADGSSCNCSCCDVASNTGMPSRGQRSISKVEALVCSTNSVGIEEEIRISSHSIQARCSVGNNQ